MRPSRRFGASVLALALSTALSTAFSPALAETPPAGSAAFPGALGFGAGAVGWRGGEVIAVTNLEDAGDGSLRACVERETPRVCIFEVSGTIELDSELRVAADVYVAGQTAPGDGIQLRLRDSRRSPLLLKNTHDVVVRYLKVRPGPSRQESVGVDGITIENAERVYIDHVSVMFATDENVNVHVSNGTAADITIANSIIAFGLENANHPKGHHSKGALICSSEGEMNACGRITLARNLFAHNRDRNPDLKATDLGPVEVVNNVFYNPGSQVGEFYNLLGETRINYVGNVVRAGPDTRKDRPVAIVEAFLPDDTNPLELFVQDVVADGCAGAAELVLLDAAAEAHRADAPVGPLATPLLPASETLDHVLATVGDRIRGGRAPDPLDARLLSQTRECRGRIIDDPTEDLGGWPEIAPAEAPVDSDGDRLPDAWETAHPPLDPAAPDDVWAIAPDRGLSLLESYLAERAADL